MEIITAMNCHKCFNLGALCINKMTLKRFEGIKSGAPLRSFLGIPAKMPILKEFFVKMGVCVFVKD